VKFLANENFARPSVIYLRERRIDIKAVAEVSQMRML